jgi:hypothetical protein
MEYFNETEEDEDQTSEKHIHTQMSTLDLIEHYIYRWFQQRQKKANARKQRLMFDAMNETQREHKGIVRKMVNAGVDLWVSTILSSENKTEIQQLWNSILSTTNNKFVVEYKFHTQSGNFQNFNIATKTSVQNELYSAFARIMSRPNGRKLLRYLNTNHSGAEKKIIFITSPRYKLLGARGYSDGIPYVGAKAVATPEPYSKIGIRSGRLANGRGSGAQVEVSPGIRDASMLDFDKKGNKILSPFFIGFGHELIHAAHYMAGSYIGPAPAHGDSYIKLPKGYANDLEEFLTISPRSEIQKFHMKNVVANLYTFTNIQKDRSDTGTRFTFRLSALTAFNRDIPTEAEFRDEHNLNFRYGHSTTANPIYYRGATKNHNPGLFVRDVVQWIRDHNL